MKGLNLLILFLMPFICSAEHNPKNAQMTRILHIMKNDIRGNRPVNNARKKMMKKVLAKRFDRLMGKLEIEKKKQKDLNRVITKFTRLNIPEVGVKRDAAWIWVPKKYRNKSSLPLVISLHGFGVSQLVHQLMVPLDNFVSKKGYILAVPAGTENTYGQHHWNGTECCDVRDIKMFELCVFKVLFFNLQDMA